MSKPPIPTSLFLLQLSLLCLFYTVFGVQLEALPPNPLHHPIYAHPPAAAPTTRHHHHTPTEAPIHTPVKPPIRKPPVYLPHQRSLVAVQGVVYCKSCKYAGIDTLLGATPLAGAKVKLICNNTKYKTSSIGRTDKNGYFFLQAPKTVTNYGAHRCKVVLVPSPSATCNKPTNLHGGIIGGVLKPEKPFLVNKVAYVLYTVGPFAFEPKCPR